MPVQHVRRQKNESSLVSEWVSGWVDDFPRVYGAQCWMRSHALVERQWWMRSHTLGWSSDALPAVRKAKECWMPMSIPHVRFSLDLIRGMRGPSHPNQLVAEGPRYGLPQEELMYSGRLPRCGVRVVLAADWVLRQCPSFG